MKCNMCLFYVFNLGRWSARWACHTYTRQTRIELERDVTKVDVLDAQPITGVALVHELDHFKSKHVGEYKTR